MRNNKIDDFERNKDVYKKSYQCVIINILCRDNEIKRIEYFFAFLE